MSTAGCCGRCWRCCCVRWWCRWNRQSGRLVTLLLAAFWCFIAAKIALLDGDLLWRVVAWRLLALVGLWFGLPKTNGAWCVADLTFVDLERDGIWNVGCDLIKTFITITWLLMSWRCSICRRSFRSSLPVLLPVEVSDFKLFWSESILCWRFCRRRWFDGLICSILNWPSEKDVRQPLQTSERLSILSSCDLTDILC